MASKQRRKQWDQGKAQAGARRKAHFAQGGTLAMWRGRAATFADRKARTNKQACRGRVQGD